MNPTEFRFRVTFSKTEAMRYTGHLDLHRTVERMLRRAKLPLAYSHGFNPHPQIQLGAALPLGITGDAELVEFWLTEERTVEAVRSAAVEVAPPGILVREVIRLDHAAIHLDRLITAGEYLADAPEDGWPADFSVRVQELLARTSIARERRGKMYDLRPLIRSMDFCDAQLRMVLTLAPSATGRPEEVLVELGLGDAPVIMRRSELVLVEEKVEKKMDTDTPQGESPSL
jgi:radical SAM-linked protein